MLLKSVASRSAVGAPPIDMAVVSSPRLAVAIAVCDALAIGRALASKPPPCSADRAEKWLPVSKLSEAVTASLPATALWNTASLVSNDGVEAAADELAAMPAAATAAAKATLLLLAAMRSTSCVAFDAEPVAKLASAASPVEPSALV